jgi:hypothetical protein
MPTKPSYEPPRVDDLGSLQELTRANNFARDGDGVTFVVNVPGRGNLTVSLGS